MIGVGNLSIGGAGKTPHIEYLIELLKNYINVATLSRGYKRETKGFRLVQQFDTALTVGDEPLQYRRKYKDIVVAVSENRAYAIPQILQNYPDTQTILLDDAFQHRGVKPGLNILLTAYDALFTDDYLLPSGRLREWRSGYSRADIIIVSKCPPEMSMDMKANITHKIKPHSYQRIYFSYYKYGHPYNFYDSSHRVYLDEEMDVILLSAIANTDYLITYLDTNVNSVSNIEYEDHHTFDHHDIEKISKVFTNHSSQKKLLITTEKDAMRLEIHRDALRDMKIPVFILPAKVRFHFDEQSVFDEDVKQFLLNFLD